MLARPAGRDTPAAATSLALASSINLGASIGATDVSALPIKITTKPVVNDKAWSSFRIPFQALDISFWRSNGTEVVTFTKSRNVFAVHGSGMDKVKLSLPHFRVNDIKKIQVVGENGDNFVENRYFECEAPHLCTPFVYISPRFNEW
jgi:hypothetical protein